MENKIYPRGIGKQESLTKYFIEEIKDVENKLEKIKAVKEVRVELDDILQRIKVNDKSRENSLTITKIQEAIMWQGMELKRLGAENPYPNSYKSENAVVDKTADGLKL